MIENFYSDPTSFPFVERAILMETIKVPYYTRLTNIKAKFYIPVLMTTFANSGTEVKTANRAPITTGFKGNIKSLPYESSNCVTMTIPKYILFQYIDFNSSIEDEKYIQKGTEFLVACVGGDMLFEHMRIIGLYTL